MQYYGECLSLCIENVFNALHLGFMVHTLHANSCIILFCIGFACISQIAHNINTWVRGWTLYQRWWSGDLSHHAAVKHLGNSLCHCYLKRFNENSMHFKWKWEWENPQTTTKWNICHIIPWRFLRSLHSDYIFFYYTPLCLYYTRHSTNLKVISMYFLFYEFAIQQATEIYI